MKITRKCRHGGDEEDDVCYMSKVNKGAQKIMIAVPDQLAVVFMWSLLTGVFIVFLMTATYLVLKFESPSPSPPPSAALHSSRAERCPTEPKHSLAARQDVGSGDVHYVFLDDDRIPRLSACSLESAVNAISGHGSGRVNVFIVGGIKRIDNYNRTFSEVSLSSTVGDLKTTYGDDRLNVTRISLEEYLECSPFRGMDMSGRSALAKFAVQLVVLWQFGGTVLDDGVVVVRGDVYRATSSAVEYGDRTISSPIACHAFVYEAMLSVKKYALGGEPFAPDTGRTILDGTATVVEALSVADWVMCRGGVAVDDHCYYEEATAESIGYRCPVAADEPPSPKFQETIIRATSPKFRKPVDPAIKTTNTAAAEDGQNRNTTDDERISAVI